MEIYNRKIKSITANGTTRPSFELSTDARIHSVQINVISAIGTNTLAALMTDLSDLKVKVGTVTIWQLTGTKLRDWVIKRGATYDFDGTPNTTGCQITLPFAPEWLMDAVADSLALNPRKLGAAVTVEMTFGTAVTLSVIERVSYDIDAPFRGFISLEVIKPVAGGTAFYVEKEIENVGALLEASIYPDSTNSREITPVSIFLGSDDFIAFDAVTSAENDEALARFNISPAISGRTSNVFDAVFVKGDALGRAINLARWGKCKIKVGAASEMAGTCDILLCRIEEKV